MYITCIIHLHIHYFYNIERYTTSINMHAFMCITCIILFNIERYTHVHYMYYTSIYSILNGIHMYIHVLYIYIFNIEQYTHVHTCIIHLYIHYCTISKGT